MFSSRSFPDNYRCQLHRCIISIATKDNGYSVSIIALGASLGCSRSQSEFARSVDVVAGIAKKKKEGG